ncbi:MAG: ROK family protein [Verrucomicrobiota bacterium]
MESNSIFLGLNLNGPTIAAQLYNVEGAALAPAAIEFSYHAEGGPESLLSRLGEITTQMLSVCEVSWSAIHSVGVAIPAPMNAEGVLLDEAALKHGAWKEWDARSALDNYFNDCQVVVENDANAAAYGDYCLLSDQQRKGVIVSVTVSNGIGGGLIADGSIGRGQGSAGEFGRLPISMKPYEHYRCGDWQSRRAAELVSATVESFASTRAFSRQLEEIFADPDFDPMLRHPLWEGGRTDKGPSFTSMAKHLPLKAQNGEELSCQLYRLREKALGQLLAAIALVCDPHLFIIGGEILRQLNDPFREAFIQGIQENLDRQLGVVKPYQVVASALGADAAVFGAAMLARDVETRAAE